MRILGASALAVTLAIAASGCTTPASEPDGGSPTSRPSRTTTPAPPTPPSQEPAASELPTAPTPTLRAQRRYVFPVRGETSYVDAHHDYPATDIFADCGTPVVAPVSGTVLEVSRRDRWDARADKPRLRGGLSWSLAGDDGVRYYGSHLSRLADRVRPGTWIAAGERLGMVGMTGNAAGNACHLHFGISPPCAETGDWWVRRGVVAPYRYLRAWQDGRGRSPAPEIGRWQRRHGCPDRPAGP